MEDEQGAIHDRQVHAVMSSVAKLLPALAGQGFSPEVIFEGAVKGGAVALMAGTEASAEDVANLLETVSDGFRHLDQPKLRVVS